MGNEPPRATPLSRWLEHHRITYPVFGRRIGVTTFIVGRIACGWREPWLSEAIKIAEVTLAMEIEMGLRETRGIPIEDWTTSEDAQQAAG
jgi:hypothetical protein